MLCLSGSAKAPAGFATPADSLAAALGSYWGLGIRASLQEMKQMGMPDISVDDLAAALAAAVRGEKGLFADAASAWSYIGGYLHPASPWAEADFTPERQKQYLDSMAALDGAVTYPDGLILQVITEGEGEMPAPGDRVLVSYTGRLSNGDVFDMTEEPIEFLLAKDSLIPGMYEGILMMRPDGRYTLTIPASLAYGENGAAGVIPPGAAITFDITYLGTKLTP